MLDINKKIKDFIIPKESSIQDTLQKINTTNKSRNENFIQIEKIIEKTNGLETLKINSTTNNYFIS